MAAPTQYLINSTSFVLTAGDWQLNWGSIDPQQLTTNKIAIIADTTINNVSIELPPSSEEQTNNVQFYIVKAVAANVLNINAAGGDSINGNPVLTINSQYSAAFLQNLFLTLWTAFQQGT